MARVIKTGPSSGIRRAPWSTITLATLLAGWTALVVVIGATQPEGPGGRVFVFAAVIAVAAVAVAASALNISDGARATALVAAGMAAAFTGVLGGFTVGLPLVPVGLTIILMGLTAAEGAASHDESSVRLPPPRWWWP